LWQHFVENDTLDGFLAGAGASSIVPQGIIGLCHNGARSQRRGSQARGEREILMDAFLALEEQGGRVTDDRWQGIKVEFAGIHGGRRGCDERGILDT